MTNETKYAALEQLGRMDAQIEALQALINKVSMSAIEREYVNTHIIDIEVTRISIISTLTDQAVSSPETASSTTN